jgi:hypothetical protein
VDHLAHSQIATPRRHRSRKAMDFAPEYWEDQPQPMLKASKVVYEMDPRPLAHGVSSRTWATARPGSAYGRTHSTQMT